VNFMRKTFCALVAILICAPIALGQDTGRLTVEMDQPGITISPRLIGLMTEEINHSYDGGLYGELVQNRIFKDDADRPVHWSLVKDVRSDGGMALDTNDPVNSGALSVSLRLDARSGRVGVANDGFWGIPVWSMTRYTASFWARGSAGFSGALVVDIESRDGKIVYATGVVPGISTSWGKYTTTLETGSVPAGAGNRLVIRASAPGSVWLSLVSLFPPTFNNRPNGNRIDLMKLLADLHPEFIRFPGGNYLEGDTVTERFDWKKTIGPLEERPGHQGPWGYRSSDGMGLLEFCEWCEDLHAEPVLAVYAGYSLKGERVPAGKALEPFVRDALDEIEYVSGDASTHWGAIRAADGHPKPFHVNFVEIGNEDFFDSSNSYDDRFTQFYDAIKAKYPKIRIIATAGVGSRNPDLRDDHFYRSSRHMLRDAGHYDDQDRGGPRVMVGEWATKEGKPTPNLRAALADAAWFMGMQRNSDLVVMSCYAPLFVNVNPGASQWSTNLIGYDAVGSFGSPSYYVQKMLGMSRGERVLPVRVELGDEETTRASEEVARGAFGMGTSNSSAEFGKITVSDGEHSLFAWDGALDQWKLSKPTWVVADGSLEQAKVNREYRAIAGDAQWEDYTISLKARKLAGENGITVFVHYRDGENFVRWSIGGRHNTAAYIEQVVDGVTTQISDSAPITLDDNKWHDLRIEVRGGEIRCYFDGAMMNKGTEKTAGALPTFFALASRSRDGSEMILQVVNASETARRMEIDLMGVEHLLPWAKTEIISGKPEDSNSIAQPMKVAPRRKDITEVSPNFRYEFGAYSVTVIHFKLEPG
jgi:alpha-L-arabinofuranosidase